MTESEWYFDKLLVDVVKFMAIVALKITFSLTYGLRANIITSLHGALYSIPSFPAFHPLPLFDLDLLDYWLLL